MASEILKPILQKGTGQPYLAIFDSGGMPIRNPITGIPLGAYITDFYFSYDEEKENIASFTLETGDPDSVDIESLQEGSTIFLQWGYIYSNGESVSSPVRVIKIRDFDCVFDDNGTHITIKCIDGTGDLRYYPPYSFSVVEGYSLSSMLDNGYNNNIGVVIEEFNYESSGQQ